MISEEERNNPSTGQMEQLLALLVAANREGQLVGLAFMLKEGDKAAIDYRGSHDMASLMAGTVLNRIAAEVERYNPSVAAAIRKDLAQHHGRL